MNIDFLNSNIYRKYPIEETNSLRGKHGDAYFILNNNFIADLNINSLEKYIFIKQINCNTSTITLEFHNRKESNSLLGLASITKTNFEPFTDSEIKNSSNGVIGKIVIYNIDQFNNISGNIIFNEQSTKILPKCIHYVNEGVTSLIDTNTNEYLKGAVTFYKGYNLDLEIINNGIKFHAIRGEGKGLFCGNICPEPDECPQCIRTINGIGPNKDNVFYLDAQNFATVENLPTENKIKLGTQVPADRLDCVRPGDKGDDGIKGPDGPMGPSGNTPQMLCYICEGCNLCNTCEIECLWCETCENCNKCELCDKCEVCDFKERGGGGSCDICEICEIESCPFCEMCELCEECEACDICEICNICEICDALEGCAGCDVGDFPGCGECDILPDPSLGYSVSDMELVFDPEAKNPDGKWTHFSYNDNNEAIVFLNIIFDDPAPTEDDLKDNKYYLKFRAYNPSTGSNVYYYHFNMEYGEQINPYEFRFYVYNYCAVSNVIFNYIRSAGCTPFFIERAYIKPYSDPPTYNFYRRYESGVGGWHNNVKTYLTLINYSENKKTNEILDLDAFVKLAFYHFCMEAHPPGPTNYNYYIKWQRNTFLHENNKYYLVSKAGNPLAGLYKKIVFNENTQIVMWNTQVPIKTFPADKITLTLNPELIEEFYTIKLEMDNGNDAASGYKFVLENYTEQLDGLARKRCCANPHYAKPCETGIEYEVKDTDVMNKIHERLHAYKAQDAAYPYRWRPYAMIEEHNNHVYMVFHISKERDGYNLGFSPSASYNVIISGSISPTQPMECLGETTIGGEIYHKTGIRLPRHGDINKRAFFDPILNFYAPGSHYTYLFLQNDTLFFNKTSLDPNMYLKWGLSIVVTEDTSYIYITGESLEKSINEDTQVFELYGGFGVDMNPSVICTTGVYLPGDPYGKVRFSKCSSEWYYIVSGNHVFHGLEVKIHYMYEKWTENGSTWERKGSCIPKVPFIVTDC